MVPMKRPSFPLWLLRDVPALMGLLASFWALIIFAMASGSRVTRADKIGKDTRDQIALMLAHAHLKLDYALWRQAYRRLGWNPRAVVLDMIAPSTLWSDTQARIAHYTHAFANMNAVVDACIEDIRERYNIAKRDVTDGCCPHRHATASRATSPALRAMEENHRSLSSLAVRRVRWIAASSQRDGGGSHSCRGPPTPQQNQQFPTRPHKRERTRMRAA